MSASERHRRLHATAAFRRLRERTMGYQQRGFPGQPLQMAAQATCTENGDGTLTISGVLWEQSAPMFPRKTPVPTMVEWFTTEVVQGVAETSPLEFVQRAGSYAALADDAHTTGPVPEAVADVMRRL